MAATSSNNSTSRAFEYDVFLSFRGLDTRNSFTDFLYEALADDGVVVFRDSEELHYGDNIEELLRAVSNSKICVVVLSKHYASSAWCLREIEHAVNLHESTGAPKILPIFLDVTPADVKLKTALYMNDLNEHKKKHGDGKVERWKAALEIIAEIKGWEGQGQGQSKLVKSIVGEILTMVKKNEKFVMDLIGIDERVNDVIRLLDIDSRDVRVIGIHGMGGIGKTTIAKLIFNKLCSYFNKCSFIDDVRESMDKHGLLYLQKQLARDLLNSNHVDSIANIDDGRRLIQTRACSKKVLIVLDDIDQQEQFEKMLGAPTMSLGLGSRVLITTRDIGILTRVHGIRAYEVSPLNSAQSLKLFSMHAFKCDSPPHFYHDLSKQIVSKTGGLPLTLKVIGAHLHGDNMEKIWIETLNILENTLPDEVLDKLMISYKALGKNEKSIFLDIACIFINVKKTRAMDVWEACGLFPRTALEVLTNKSLIKIYRCLDHDGYDYEYIWMHDQLRELGRKIVSQKSPEDVTRRSRLWNHKEAQETIKCKKRKDEVKALVLDKWSGKPFFITIEELESLPNLRFLKLKGGTFVGNFETNTSNLKCIDWDSPPPSYQLTNFYLKEIIYFKLSNCVATECWGGWNLLKVVNKLKVLLLEGCRELTKTPNFSGCLSLEKLSLRECSSIQVIDSTIEKLISLVHLDISHTKIVELPNSIRHLRRLKVLIMNYCLIKKLPSTIGNLESLEELHVRYCQELEGELPSEIGRLSFLRILRLSYTNICAMPSTIISLTNLEELELEFCNELQELPELPLNLSCLSVRSSSLWSVSNLATLTNLVKLHLWSDFNEALMPISSIEKTSLVQWIGRSSKLEDMKLCLPIVFAPSTELGMLVGESFNSKIISSWFSNLKCLTKLELCNFPIDEIRLSGLEVLRHLKIKDCKLLKGLSISSNLKMLKEMSMLGCPLLVEIQILEELESLIEFHNEDCNSLQRISGLSNCKNLISVSIQLGDWAYDSVNSKIVWSWLSYLKFLTKLKLSHFPLDRIGLNGLEALRHLYIHKCELLEGLLISSSLRMLERLVVSECPLLEKIQIHGELEPSGIQSCNSLKRSCDLFKLRNLEVLCIYKCNELQEIEIFDNLESLRDFYVNECWSLRRIGGLSNCKNLRSIYIGICHGLKVVEGINKLETLENLKIVECGSLEELVDVHCTKVKDDCLICIWECEKLPKTGRRDTPLVRYREMVISSARGEEEKLDSSTDMESSPSTPSSTEVEMVGKDDCNFTGSEGCSVQRQLKRIRELLTDLSHSLVATFSTRLRKRRAY